MDNHIKALYDGVLTSDNDKLRHVVLQNFDNYLRAEDQKLSDMEKASAKVGFYRKIEILKTISFSTALLFSKVRMLIVVEKCSERFTVQHIFG